MAFDATSPTSVNCVYAISGAYGLLPRILYYATLALAIFGRTKEWLVIGALVSALTYAGTAAIHSMALVTSKIGAFDLDVYGCWAVLSTAALGFVAFSHWSKTLRNSRARWVMTAWGFLVGEALIFGRVELFDTRLSPGEPPCYSSSGRLLRYPIQLQSPEFNCTYACFSARSPMRQSSELIAVPRHVISNYYSHLSLVLVGPIMFAAYTSLSLDVREHSPSQVCTRLVMRYLQPTHHEDITKLIYNASNEKWYGGYFVLFHYIHRSPWSLRKALISFISFPWFMLELAVDLLCLPLMVVNVVLNEMMILRSNLPVNEAYYAVGQWGPWVSSALVIIAACINRWLEEKAKRKQSASVSTRGSAGGNERAVVTSDVEMGDMESDAQPGKQGGVVGVPEVRRSETLTEDDTDILWTRPKR